MKKYILAFLSVFVLLAGCVGGKKIPLVKEPVFEFNAPYYQEIFPGQEDGQIYLILTLPVTNIVYGYTLDSVYFHSYHEKLVSSASTQGIEYRAKILVPKNPILDEPPYPISETEALLSYTDPKGKRKLFKLENIIKREPIFQP